MATHRITLTDFQTQGPYDIYYRTSDSLQFILLNANVTDETLADTICVSLPQNAVEMKIINKHLNSNLEIYKTIPQ